MLNIHRICLRTSSLRTLATIATRAQSTAIPSNNNNTNNPNITQFESDDSLVSELSSFADATLSSRGSITARRSMKSYSGSESDGIETSGIETELAQAHAGLLDSSEYLTLDG